jgi:hypothetical protein
MNIPVGAIIVSIFAIIWTAAGTHQLGGCWFALLSSISFLISLAVIYAATRLTPAHPVVFNATAYNISVAFEAVLIFLTVVFLVRAGYKQFLMPVTSIIVGLHFFGMVWALESNLYWFVGAAICFLSILTMSILPQTLWRPVVGLGCAVILWSSVICAFFL